MKKTFEHLLGISARDALAILRSAGIFGVRVTYTAAPGTPAPRPCAMPTDEPEEHSMLHAVAGQFEVSEDAAPQYDPLLEPITDDGMLSEARVVGVRDDGRQLIVARFKVTPKETKNE